MKDTHILNKHDVTAIISRICTLTKEALKIVYAFIREIY